MNIALEDTKEFVDGKLRRNYGDAFVRGNNGKILLFLSLFWPPTKALHAPANLCGHCLIRVAPIYAHVLMWLLVMYISADAAQ